MTKDEILEYIFLCISYKHNNDISPYITKSACEKENLLFENAIEFLDKLEKENAELKEKLKPENCLKLLAKEGYIKFTSDQLTYAKTIIQDLLDNTDEYARQRAEDFLKENK